MFRRLDSLLALGALLGAAGCSDPVPAPAKVGLHLRLTGPGCSQPINKYLPTFEDAPSATVSGNPIEDGRNGFQTSCRVSGGGASYAVAASIATPALGIDTVSFSMNATVANNTGTTPTLSANVAQTMSFYEVDGMCTLNVISIGTVPQIQPGSAWFSFNCPTVRDRSLPSGVTCIADGEVMLADCSQ